MNKKILYVSDLDGTLLNTQGVISERSLNIINELIEKGMHFTYATARSLVSASKVTKGLNTHIPVIVYNGAFIMEADTGEILYSHFFTEKEKTYVKTILTEFKQFPLVYTFVEGKEKVLYYSSYENEGSRSYLNKRKNDPRMQAYPLDKDIYEGNNFYYTCIGEKEDLENIYHIFAADERYTCTFQKELYCESYWLEIMPKLATKANAIQHLKALWDCQYVVSFGDAINDLPMFKVSDECYALENAVMELKENATEVIKGNNEDGVALWLQNNVK